MSGAVLIANRGEVAVRIVRACRELGLRSIAIHTDVDAGSLPTRVADAGVRVPSYLDVDAVVGAALDHAARAVHPGYGLLAEDAGFAQAVADAGLVFVGPPAEVVAAMGDKVRARALARECAVPVLDGTDEAVDAGEAGDAAARIGFPLLVKAAHGGGGRGMRVVAGPDELPGALAAAEREAAAAFGRGEVFLERHVARARHVEVQILADHHGAVAVLGDRDCTVQRRHQKLLEEAPAPDLPDAVRTELHEASRRLAAAVGYRGAGTVEFLVDRDTGAPAFLEMNTRLQVEHGVTEMVTGVDLVVAQLRIADGERLDPCSGTVDVRGHAVQARIAAEDPWEDFRPAPGRVAALTLPSGPWVRCDLGVEAGDAVARGVRLAARQGARLGPGPRHRVRAPGRRARRPRPHRRAHHRALPARGARPSRPRRDGARHRQRRAGLDAGARHSTRAHRGNPPPRVPSTSPPTAARWRCASPATARARREPPPRWRPARSAADRPRGRRRPATRWHRWTRRSSRSSSRRATTSTPARCSSCWRR